MDERGAASVGRRGEESAPEYIARAIHAQRAGYALTHEFYCDPVIFEREARRIILKHWHCAGHESQVAEPGAYFTVDICGESVIVVRG